MIPIKMTLLNILQYKAYEYVFLPGVTGITGPNGAGKSNLICLGLWFALSGETLDGRVAKSLLRWGSSKGSSELVFDHEGDTVVITRTVPTSSAKLVRKDKNGKEVESVSGVGEVRRCLEDMLDAPLSLIKEVCFCAQGSLTTVVKATPASRKTFFQTITGTLTMEKMRTLLQRHLSNLPLRASREEESEALQLQLTDIETRKAQALGKLTKLNADFGGESAIATKMAGASELLKLPLATEVDDKLNSLLASIAQAEKDEAALQALVPIVPSAENLPDVSALSEMRRIHADWDRVSGQIVPADPEKVELPNRSGLDAVRTELAELKPKYAMAKAGVCPTCERPYQVENPEQIISQYEVLVERAQKASADFTRTETLHVQYTKTVEARRQVRTQRESDIKRLQEQYVKFGKGAVESWDEDAYNKAVEIVATRERVVSKAESARKAVTDKQNVLDSLRLERKRLQVIGSTVTEDERLKATRAKEACEQLLAAYRELRGELGRLEGSKEALQATVVAIGIHEVRRLKEAEMRKVYEKAREVLHRDGMPKLMLGRFLSGLSAYLEYHLLHFNAPFSARIDEDADILFRMHGDPDERSAQFLSLGQTVALSVAFWTSLFEMVGTGFPVFVLDEPSVWLDEENMLRLSDLLDKLREPAEGGLYIQVPTHEQALLAAMTRVIDVTGQPVTKQATTPMFE